MNSRKLLAVFCVLSFTGNFVQAAPPLTPADARAQINSDAALISGWLSDQFKRAVPYNSTAGNVIPSQIQVLGFEVGAEAVVTGTKVDTGGFHNLGTQLVDTNKIDTFERLPLPMILGQAKIGLPFGFDAGVRIGGIPSTSHDEGSTHLDTSNSVFGIDLRKALIDEGELHPFGLTLGLNFTRAKGHITATTPYTSSSPNVTFGSDAMGSSRTDWDTKSVGVQAIMNKKILFLNPYIGAAANKNFGSVNTAITNSGSFTVNGIPGTLDGTGGSASSTPNTWDLRGMAGIEFSILPFIRLGIGGEIASQGNVTGSLGLRFQFR